MRFSTAALLASALALPTGGAFAQSTLPAASPATPDVTVNLGTAAQGRSLLYAGGGYGGAAGTLLQPGENPADRGPITLHMPPLHPARTASAPPARHETHAVAETAPAPKPEKAAPAPSPAPTPAPHRAAAAQPKAPSSSSGYNPGYGAFGVPPGGSGSNSGSADLGDNLVIAKPPGTAEAAPTPKAVQTAKVAPAPSPSHTAPAADHATPGLTKRSVILFAPNSASPAQSALGAIKFLAGDLNAAMTTPSARVQLEAYGGPKGDKGSDARRLSLKRALAIRQVLIDDGVSAARIDVRAMGGVDDSGPADRVDVYLKAG